MLSHIWMKVGSKLQHEELQIKFDFCHGWHTFSWVIALCSKFVFRTFLGYAFTYLNGSWLEASTWRVTDQVQLLSRLTHFFMSYCPLFKICFPDFSWLCFHIYEWKLVGSFLMKSYRSSSTFVTVDLLLNDLLSFLKKNSFPHFSFFCMKSYTSSLKHQIIKKNHLMDRVILVVLYFKKAPK